MEKQDLYIIEQGSTVKKSGENFLVTNNGEKVFEISHRKIGRIFLVGSQSITPKAVNFALEKKKDILFISKSGRIKGTILSTSDKNVFLRLAQYEKFRDIESKVKIARFFLKRKIKKQIEFLKKNKIEISLEKYVNRVERGKSINELLGIEGELSKFYFGNFNKFVKSDLEFEKRSRRPAENEFNALLNLTYGITKNNILSKLEKEGFDSYIGYLHSVKYGRESLTLDLIEEIRADCDNLVIKWVNRKEFKKTDFIKLEEGIVLSELAFRKYLEKYSDEYNRIIEKNIDKAINEFKEFLLED